MTLTKPKRPALGRTEQRQRDKAEADADEIGRLVPRITGKYAQLYPDAYRRPRYGEGGSRAPGAVSDPTAGAYAASEVVREHLAGALRLLAQACGALGGHPQDVEFHLVADAGLRVAAIARLVVHEAQQGWVGWDDAGRRLSDAVGHLRGAMTALNRAEAYLDARHPRTVERHERLRERPETRQEVAEARAAQRRRAQRVADRALPWSQTEATGA